MRDGVGEAAKAALRMNIHPTPPRILFASTLPLQGRVKEDTTENARKTRALP
jgi:hypothetical protein